MTQERYQEAAEAAQASAAVWRDTWPERFALLNELAAVADKLAAGWVLVPGEPTPEMMQAAHAVGVGKVNWLAETYQAMIAAAPKP